MAGKIKCYECGRVFDNNLAGIIDGKKYCPICKEGMLAESKARDEIIAILKEQCDDENYIPRFMREIKNVLESHKDWGYFGIRATLDYVFNLLETPLNFDPMRGITWIIEFYYAEAIKYFKEIEQLNKIYKAPEVSEMINQPIKEVVVKRSTLEIQDREHIDARKNRMYGPEIDLNKIDWGDN